MDEVLRIRNRPGAVLLQGDRHDVEAVRGHPELVKAIALCAKEVQPTMPGSVEGVRVPMDDWDPLREQFGRQEGYEALLWAYRPAADRAARWCIKQLLKGEPGNVLVTCNAGLNRSGLVTGLTLRMLGYSGSDAVAMVRQARGPQALCNGSFRKIVEDWKRTKVTAPS